MPTAKSSQAPISKPIVGDDLQPLSQQTAFDVEAYLEVLLANSPDDAFARSWVEQTVRTLADGGKASLSVRGIAETLQVSERHLMRVVGRLTGKSVSEIRRDIRMRRARYFVEEGSKSILSIAQSFGYSTTSGFCRDFRRVFDCAPLQWRNNLKVSAPQKFDRRQDT